MNKWFQLSVFPGPFEKTNNQTLDAIHTSAAAGGWAGWALAHPEFGSLVNPITTRGADYAHHITASPPGFENPAAALLYYWHPQYLSPFGIPALR